MSDPEKPKIDLERYIDAVAPALGLKIAEKDRAEVLLHFGLATSIAQPLMDFPLDEKIEPATVFTPQRKR